ncbi:RimK family alpha-L-glutamate ligase [Streptomyces sp. NPDC058603]|uniref:ATP-grasp domain-containing protein n=1 Tax=Streptomyces sp. NPDC058603 TaxID=3346551 RepID=UPI003658AA3F
MRLCFVVEEQYRFDGMPVEVIRQLAVWGHRVDVVRPGTSLLRLSEVVRAGGHDAWVLKTVSGGPGLALLEAAAAVGLTTVNDARSIRGVRDKVVAAVIGRGRGLPVPETYAVARPELLAELPAAAFPLVVKPAEGSSGRGVRLVRSPDSPAASAGPPEEGMLIAQPYIPNSGVDLKVYGVGGELFATERSSPLHPGAPRRERSVALSAEVAGMVAEAGEVYGLDLFGVDVLLGPDGPVIVDVNDFPSFRCVPDAVARVARAVLDLARTGGSAPGTAAVGPLPPPDPVSGPVFGTMPAPVPEPVPVPGPVSLLTSAGVPFRIPATAGEAG